MNQSILVNQSILASALQFSHLGIYKIVVFRSLIASALSINLFLVQTLPASAALWSDIPQRSQSALDGAINTAKQVSSQAAESRDSFDISAVPLPNVQIPNFELPELPQLDIDISNTSISVPELALPNFDFSSVNLPNSPDIDFSNVTLPTFDLANVSENLQSALAQASGATQRVYQNSFQVFDNVDLFSLIISGSAAYSTVSQSLQSVPQDFATLLKEMPKVARRVKYRAGLRPGEVARSSEEAMKLFRKIPGSALMEGKERQIWIWLSNKDGSHIQSYANGGSSSADNIFWEFDRINRARGAANTTQVDQILSRFYNGAEAVVQNSATIAKLGLKTTAIAVLIDAIVETEIHAIDLANGTITIEEFLADLQTSASRTAISAAAFYTLTVIAISIFPELVPLLATPSLITASQIIFGSRLALPLLRLIPAL